MKYRSNDRAHEADKSQDHIEKILRRSDDKARELFERNDPKKRIPGPHPHKESEEKRED
jgi:hypothetical protein